MAWCEKCGHDVGQDELVSEPFNSSKAASGLENPDDGQAGRPERCPACGTALVEGEASDEETHPKAPWHFKVLVVGSVGYLGYRLYQGIGWLIHHA
jgi:hypothetical protein